MREFVCVCVCVGANALGVPAELKPNHALAMAVANNGNNGSLDGIELEALGIGSISGAAGGAGTSSLAGGSGGGGTPKPKRAAVTKKLQFSTPEFSVTPIPAVSVVGNRLMPSRKR